MQTKVGQRLASTVCATEAIVIRAASTDIALTCGGAPVVEVGDAAAHGDGTPTADSATGTALGKRYVTPDGDLELLCTKAGDGALAVDGVVLGLKAAKSLPSSD